MKKLTLLLLLVCSVAYADPPLRQVGYVSGTTIRSDDVTDNEDELFGYLQTGVNKIRTDGLDAITEIHSALRSGSDNTIVTGTKGTSGNYASWNADGDLVDGGDILTEAELDTFSELQTQIADKTLVNEEDTQTIDSAWTFSSGITSNVIGNVTGNLTGNVTGNADTSTALAANGGNCAAGQSPLGVDASGAVESCFDVWTEAENTSAGYISATLTQEEVDDYVNALIKDADSVHTRVTITYDDTDNAFDFVVDDMNDDVPDAGDFGAAIDLDADGALTTDSVDDNEINYTNVTLNDLTFDVGSVSKTEHGYLDGVASAIQTQIDSKEGTLSNSTGLANALNDETGTGQVVFNDSPTVTDLTVSTNLNITAGILTDDSIQADDIDLADFTCADLTTSDCGAITSSGGITATGLVTSVDIQTPTIYTENDIVGEPKTWDFTIINPNGVYDTDTEVFIGVAKSNLTITKLQISNSVSSQEVTGYLRYADTFITLANPVVINDFDTTSGERTDTSISTCLVAAAKVIYLDFTAQPHEDITQTQFHIEWEY